jgi:crotonobetainyl-CoA:carnitine CoA-transferase CaiB-like acyl-CoA transferase
LDLRLDASLEIVRRLVDRADVFLSNCLEPSLRAMGLGYEELSERNGDIVNSEPGAAKPPPPSLGQHNEEILTSLGYEPSAIGEITDAAHSAMLQRLDA